MRSRDIKRSWLGSDSGSESGFLTPCRYCGDTIYMHLGADGRYRPFESWVAGNASDGQWAYHDCTGSGRSRRRDPNHVDLPPMKPKKVSREQKRQQQQESMERAKQRHPSVACPHCHAMVQERNLDKHMRRRCPALKAERAPSD